MNKVKCPYCGSIGIEGTKCHACSKTIPKVIKPIIPRFIEEEIENDREEENREEENREDE